MTSFRRRARALVLPALAAAVTLTSPVVAQQPGPRPAVSIAQFPAAFSSTVVADFDRDGDTDLFAMDRQALGSSMGFSAIWLNDGSGHFSLGDSLNFITRPLAAADFSGDGFPDVVIADRDGTIAVATDGTGRVDFNTTVRLTNTQARFAVTGDLNSDGHRDILLGEGGSTGVINQLVVHYGTGNATFPNQSTFATSATPQSAIIADFNGDGRSDFAVALAQNQTIIFIKSATGTSFQQATVPMAGELWDITARDLNGDSRQDLIVVESGTGAAERAPGSIYVALGNGNGTFQTPLKRPTGARGSVTVVAVDFNRDGKVDVATGNRSSEHGGGCAGPFQYWDSITIMPGRGDAMFDPSATFRLDTATFNSTFAETHDFLQTSDLDGDGRTDLIASPAGLVFNRPPTANTPPTIDLGPDIMASPEPLIPAIVEPDWDWLRVEWRDDRGQVVSTTPTFCYSPDRTTTLTATVTDARGGSSSDDIRVIVPPPATPFLFVVVPRADERVVAGHPFTVAWDMETDARIGSFRVSSSIDNGHTWSTIDECRSVARTSRQCTWHSPGPVMNGARVRVEALDSSGSLVTLANSSRFNIVETEVLPRRWASADIGAVGITGSASFSEASDQFTVSGAGADIWRTADAFRFTYFRLVADGFVSMQLLTLDGPDPWTKAGLMIRRSLDPSSAHHFLLASRGNGFAYQRRLSDGGTSFQTPLGGGGLPAHMSVERSGSRFTLWLTRDFSTRERVAEFTFDGPVYIGMAVTSHNTGALATATFNAVETRSLLPPTVEVSRPAAGEVITREQPFVIRWNAEDPDGELIGYDVFYSSEDGAPGTWFEIQECTGINADFPTCEWHVRERASNTARIRVLAYDDTQLAGEGISAPFVVRNADGSDPLPLRWGNHDEGGPEPAGSTQYDQATGTFTVTGAGADIWGDHDQFQFASTLFSGDFAITTRVNRVENVHRWTKAGLMVREYPNYWASAHASVFATPTTEKGVAMQSRLIAGGSSVSTSGPAFAPPYWIRIERRGDLLVGRVKKNLADAWITIGESRIANLSNTVEIGLAVSSHVDGTLATAAFTNVSIESLAAWQGTDIGAVGAAGSFTVNGMRVTAHGAGADIWGTADAFHYVYTPWTGDGTITARVVSVENVNAWTKAGVMFRETLTPGSRHVMAIVSPAKGVAMQYRTTAGAASTSTTPVAGMAPRWIRLTRSANTFTAQTSTDGATWTTLGTTTIPINTNLFVGLPVTSHVAGRTATAVFDDVAIRR